MSPVISEISDENTEFAEFGNEIELVEEDEVKTEKELVCVFATNPHKGACVGEVSIRKDLGMALCDKHYKYLKNKEARKEMMI